MAFAAGNTFVVDYNYLALQRNGSSTAGVPIILGACKNWNTKKEKPASF
ncbi:hypothetical protein [Sphingobacterium sp.]